MKMHTNCTQTVDKCIGFHVNFKGFLLQHILVVHLIKLDAMICKFGFKMSDFSHVLTHLILNIPLIYSKICTFLPPLNQHGKNSFSVAVVHLKMNLLFSILRRANKTTARIGMTLFRGLMLEGKEDTNQTVFYIQLHIKHVCNSICACWKCIPACVWVFGNRDGIMWEENQVKETSALAPPSLSLRADFDFPLIPFWAVG